MRAARQLVTLDPYFGIGWNRILRSAMALDRRTEVEERYGRCAQFPGQFYRQAWIARLMPSLTDVPMRRGPRSRKSRPLAQGRGVCATLLPWALGESDIDPVKLRAAIADAPPGEAAGYFIAGRT